VIRVRREFPLLRSQFYIHKPDQVNKRLGYNIHWLNSAGLPMTEKDWINPNRLTLGWMLESVVNARCVHCLLTIFDAGSGTDEFMLPEGWHWVALLDTASNDGVPVERYFEVGKPITVEEKSVIVLYGMSSQCDLADADDLLVTPR
jgi:pullulanase/glycogen debranching enzyme